MRNTKYKQAAARIPQIAPAHALRYRLEKVLQEAAKLRILIAVASQLETIPSKPLEQLAAEIEGVKHDN
jgi:hypothetical protein